ncbi:hypothetical protein WA171_002657, partial [Blastocystis sp. BT1]
MSESKPKENRKRPASKISKTRLCFEWVKKGSCQYGDKCRFVHGDISEALDIGDQIGRNRENQDLLREQSTIRQSLKNREDIQHVFSEVHLDSFKLSKSCMIDRYYTQLFAADTGNRRGNDISICMHSNTICIVGLAFGHEILVAGKKCVGVAFGKGKDHRPLLNNEVQGKRKKGGIWVEEGTVLCDITCDDGSVYSICACLRGRLLEVNSRLLEEPWLLNQKPRTDGFIALFIPKVTDVMNIQKSLLTAQEYIHFFKERQEGS